MKYIALHHSITPQSMASNRAIQIIEDTHITNFGKNPSKFNGSSIGYNFTVDGLGQIKQWREIGEETMAQKGYNFDTISICMLIDGDKEYPNATMLFSVKKLVKDLRAKYGALPLKPHRWFTGGGSLCQYKNDKPKQSGCPHKSCCGSMMSDYWIDNNFNYNLDQVKVTTTTKTVYTACQLGDISDNVDRIQDLLVSLGYLKNKNTYKEYDELVAEAVNKYQTDNKIGTALERAINKGYYIGPKTLAVLNK